MFTSKREELINIGYNKLLKENKLDYLIKLSNRLAKQTLIVKHNAFKTEKKNLEKCVIQFLIQRVLYISFNERILEALGKKNRKLKIALPKQWLKYLEEEGFKADTFSNKIRWYGFVLFWFLGGFYKICICFFQGIKHVSNPFNSQPYIYFDNLSIKNLPIKSSSETRTIIDWYIKYGEEDFNEINHQVKSPEIKIKGKVIAPTHLPIKINLSIIEWLIYLANAIYFTLKSVFYFLMGDFSHAILLKEYPLLYLAQKSKKENLANKYLFHNSTSIFRPLWTYEVEIKGAEIIFYYYSTSNSVLKFDKGYHREYGNREFMSWDNFYVWNSHQAQYVRGYFPNSKIKIVGPIWFESSYFDLEKINKDKKIISIFDIQPFREHYFRILGIPDRYITTNTVKQFQKDIHRVFSEKDVKVVMKRKREETKGIHDPTYLSYINSLYNNEKFIQIPPETDALSLIEQSYLTINFPPTSTANISRYCNVHSIYYDPISTIDPKDEALFGIRLIRGFEELKDYVTNELLI